MFDEYTLLTDTDTTIDICDGHDLDDIFGDRFDYEEFGACTFYSVEVKNNG